MPPAPAIEPTIDILAAHPQFAAVRAALTAHDWPAVRVSYASLDWAGRDMLATIAADTDGAAELLRGVLATDPTDTLAAAVLGICLTDEGWAIRTAQRAKYVSKAQFSAFHDYLCRAEQVLIDATARDPGNVVAWTRRLITALGLQLGEAEARRRYGRLATHHPHHLPAQSALLQHLCPKWGGSFDKMHQFAWECMLAAAPGAHNGVLVVYEHVERGLEYADEGSSSIASHFRRPEVRAEIAEAARRSVLHPDFRHDIGWVGVRNAFAMAFSLGGDHQAAAGQFAALGPLATEYPWEYLGDPVAKFTVYRERAYQKGA